MLGKHASIELHSYPQLVAFKSTKGTKATETGEMYPSEREERNRTAEYAGLGTEEASVAMESIRRKPDGGNASFSFPTVDGCLWLHQGTPSYKIIEHLISNLFQKKKNHTLVLNLQFACHVIVILIDNINRRVLFNSINVPRDGYRYLEAAIPIS